MDSIAAGFQESQDLKDAGFPQGTSFFRWYWGEKSQAILCPRHERFQWAAKMKTGEEDALCDGYPVDWGLGMTEWCDAPTAEEIVRWKPSAVLFTMGGIPQASDGGGTIEMAATLANTLARAVAPRK